MKTAAVFVFLVALVSSEETRSSGRQPKRRGRQYEHFDYTEYNGGESYYKGQEEVPYEQVQQHHQGSPQEVQYQNPFEINTYKSEGIQLPSYEHETGQNQVQQLPLDSFEHGGSYDFQFENQVPFGFGNKAPTPDSLQYVPVTATAVPGTVPSLSPFPPIVVPNAPHVPVPSVKVPLLPPKHLFPPQPNPFPVPPRFQFQKNILITPNKAPSPSPPPPPPPPKHLAPVKPTSFKLNLLQPVLKGSLPPPALPQPLEFSYHVPQLPKEYFVPVPVVTKVPPPPPPPPKVPPPPPPVSPFVKFFRFFKHFKLS